MKKNCLLCFLIFTTVNNANATFSIVAVDPQTGEIGSAGATCIGQENGAIVISDIVLGQGVIHTQSFWSPTNQNNAKARMLMGERPQEIMDWLANNTNDVSNNSSQRQYLAVDLIEDNQNSAAFTGPACFSEFHQVTGQNYAIAGNILLSTSVVTDMETAFLNNKGSLSDKLMAALQAAKRVGADSRCSDFEISSASAFLRVARPCDIDASYGNLPLDINVWVESDIFEPIDELQKQYDDLLDIQACEIPFIFKSGFEPLTLK